MKTINIYKRTALVLAITSVSLFSCSEEINELQNGDSSEIGAYARIKTSTENKNTNILDVDSSIWDATIEFVDEKQGSLIESYSLYATFRDNTVLSDTDPDYSIKEEVLINTWGKSTFQEGTPYPTLTFSVNAKDVVTKLGLDLSKADGGDTFVYRGEIKLSDGRTFSTTNSGKSITSEFFYNDAFGFSSTFVCVPASPITGDWKIEMIDTYGDGWNGGYISVFIDGTETKYRTSNALTSVTVTVPSATSELDWKYTAGNWEEENKFKIYAPSGNLVLSDGPTPNTGTLALNLCKE